MSDYEDYYAQCSDGFASGPEEEGEFEAVDTLTNRRFRMDRKVNPAWRDLDQLKDVRFNFAVFFEGLHRCSQDLRFGNIEMRTHFGRFLQHFETVLECGWLPELYIVRVQSLLESTKPLLSRLEGTQRLNCKARMKEIMTDLEGLREDSFMAAVEVVERQAKEIKALQARVQDLEAQLAQPHSELSCLTDTQSSSAVAHSKSVKCQICQLLLPTDSFSGSQLAKRKGRKCASCVSIVLQASSVPDTTNLMVGSAGISDLSRGDSPHVLVPVPETCNVASPIISDLDSTSFAGAGLAVPTGKLPVSLAPAVRTACVRALEPQHGSSPTSSLSSLSSLLTWWILIHHPCKIHFRVRDWWGKSLTRKRGQERKVVENASYCWIRRCMRARRRRV